MPHDPPRTEHARRRAQQRGKKCDALALVYRHGDRERRAGAARRRVSLSRRACAEVRALGFPAALVERATRIELVVADYDACVVTVLNAER